jgi:hypothetical protein
MNERKLSHDDYVPRPRQSWERCFSMILEEGRWRYIHRLPLGYMDQGPKLYELSFWRKDK